MRTRSVFIEEYARKMIAEEEQHLGEVNKMLRKPGEIARFRVRDCAWHRLLGRSCQNRLR